MTLSGMTPYFIVERSPEAQKVYNKMGACFSKLQKKIKSPKVITANWKERQFKVQENKDAEEQDLVKILDDLSLEWDASGVQASGFMESELIAAPERVLAGVVSQLQS